MSFRCGWAIADKRVTLPIFFGSKPTQQLSNWVRLVANFFSISLIFRSLHEKMLNLLDEDPWPVLNGFAFHGGLVIVRWFLVFTFRGLMSWERRVQKVLYLFDWTLYKFPLPPDLSHFPMDCTSYVRNCWRNTPTEPGRKATICWSFTFHSCLSGSDSQKAMTLGTSISIRAQPEKIPKVSTPSYRTAVIGH